MFVKPTLTMLHDLPAIRLIYGDTFADALESFQKDLSTLWEVHSLEIFIPMEDWYTLDLMTKTMEPNEQLPYLVRQQLISSFAHHFYGVSMSYKDLFEVGGLR